jgi:nucleoside-diphosphate-sugar epimerase
MKKKYLSLGKAIKATMIDNEKRHRQPKEIYFQNKNVIITGGAAGIGQALAEKLSQLGASVTVLDITPVTNSDHLTSQVIDVTDSDSFSKLTDLKPDILIIAAGVTSDTNSPTEQEIAAMDAVNIDGVRNTLKLFHPLLTDHAQIVYVGTDDPPKDHYKMTKTQGAEIVRQFSDQNPKVDVRLLLVGPVRTQLFEKGKPAEIIERIKQNVGLYEPLEFAEEVVEDLLDRSDGLKEVKMYKAN